MDVVFVFGPRRSGSTVFRLMLDGHPEVHNVGERDFLGAHLRRTPEGGLIYDLDALRADRSFIDSGCTVPADHDPGRDGAAPLLRHFLEEMRKDPRPVYTVNLHEGLDRVLELLPQARAIRLLRDPRDVVRSVIALGWAQDGWTAAGNMVECHHAWEAAARRLGEGRSLTVRYEDLVQDAPGELTKVCAFLGVAYDARMLSYPDYTTYTPIDPSMAGQWRGKLADADLRLAEARLREIIPNEGYELSGRPVDRPSAARLMWMRQRNRWARIRSEMGDVGFWPVFNARVGARLGLQGMRMRGLEVIYAHKRSKLK